MVLFFIRKCHPRLPRSEVERVDKLRSEWKKLSELVDEVCVYMCMWVPKEVLPVLALSSVMYNIPVLVHWVDVTTWHLAAAKALLLLFVCFFLGM